MASNTNKSKKTETEAVPEPIPAVAPKPEETTGLGNPDADEFGNPRVEYEPFSGYYSTDGFGRTVYVIRGLEQDDFATALQDAFGRYRVTVLSTGITPEDEFDSIEAVRAYIRSEFFRDVVLPGDEPSNQ